VRLHVARFGELSPALLYALLRLRVDVFVVEQHCPYPELDGRDLEPGTRHVWLADAGTPVAYLRMLAEPDGSVRVGRVCVARPARGRGLAGELMSHALELAGPDPCVLHAQAHLAGFYAGLGFTPTGPELDDDGIPHVPMRRDPGKGKRDPGKGKRDPGQETAYGSAATSSATERRRPV
jgi:ElaA protein